MNEPKTRKSWAAPIAAVIKRLRPRQPNAVAGVSVSPSLQPRLAPFHGPPTPRSRVYLGYALLGFWALLYGLFYAFFTPYFLLAFAVPLVLLAVLTIWALPSDLSSTLDRPLRILFYAFLWVLIVWPNYLAVAIPGLPWITFIRLVAVPLLFVFLICLSTSQAVRSTLSQVIKSSRIVVILYIGFAVDQTLTLVFSQDLGGSFDRYVTAETTWTSIFFISMLVFSKPGRIELWSALLWVTAVVVAVLGVWEYKLGHVVWAGHVPSFLKIENPDVQRIMQGQMRAYTGVYRVQATFSTSLGLGEFIAYALPFILYFAIENYPKIVRFLAFAMVPPLFFVTLVSGSRAGMIGFLLTLLAYGLAWGAIRWRRVRGGLLGPAIVWAYPTFVVLFYTATLFVGRLHRMVWGGGETASSTDARRIQYQMGWPKILSHPWGYGIGRGGVVLGFYEPNGLLSIDTYYLQVALDYGVLGFILYYGAFLFAIGGAAQNVLVPFEQRNREAGFLLPAGICLINFVVIKSVFAQQDNHPLVFMVLGMTLALICRIRQDAGLGRVARSDSARLKEFTMIPSARAGSEKKVVA